MARRRGGATSQWLPVAVTSSLPNARRQGGSFGHELAQPRSTPHILDVLPVWEVLCARETSRPGSPSIPTFLVAENISCQSARRAPDGSDSRRWWDGDRWVDEVEELQVEIRSSPAQT